jgi:hypothetical protein
MKKFAFFRRAILFLIISASFAGVTAAQVVGRFEQTESNAVPWYYYVSPGSRTIQIEVMGAVQAPGLYELNDDTSLNQLLALTGGPTMGPRAARMSRTVTLSLFRPASGSVTPVYESEILDGSLYAQNYPPLREGDVLRVDVVERTRFNWRDALQIITAAASAYLVFDRAR